MYVLLCSRHITAARGAMYNVLCWHAIAVRAYPTHTQHIHQPVGCVWRGAVLCFCFCSYVRAHCAHFCVRRRVCDARLMVVMSLACARALTN